MGGSTAAVPAKNPYAGYFTSDRAVKYGLGLPRLLLVTLFAFEVVPRFFLDDAYDGAARFSSSAGQARDALMLAPYLASLRWVGHSYMVGAVQVESG